MTRIEMYCKKNKGDDPHRLLRYNPKILQSQDLHVKCKVTWFSKSINIIEHDKNSPQIV